jgi:4a-hydroxytetrahydrobiopterin dehydratase
MKLMNDLADKKCIPCEGGIPSFNIEEIHKYLKKVDGWDVQSVDEKDYYIIKNFKFNNFLESQSFVNKVGEIAEQEGHHPDIWFGWGYAKIKIQTHAINGLHESDFVLAAKIDRIG